MGTVHRILGIATVVCAASAAQAQTCNAVVAGLSAAPNPPSGYVYTMTTYDDGVHGPRFYAAGSMPNLGNVAVLTPTGWQSLGATLANPVYTLEVIPDGLGPSGGPSLYAAGTGVFRWDTDHWQSLGTIGTVYGLVMYDDRLGGGPALHAIANQTLYKRSPSGTWQQKGTVSASDPTRLVQRVLVFDEDGPGPLPSCIYFTSGVSSATPISGTGSVSSSSGLVRWDGQAFYAIPNAHSGAPNTLSFGAWIKAAAVFDDGGGAGPQLYISGHANAGENSIVRWNSATQMWNPVGPATTTGFNGAAYGLIALSDGIGPLGRRLYAITQSNESFNMVQPSATVVAWDGVAWSAVRNTPNISVLTPNYHHAAAAGVLGPGRVPAALCMPLTGAVGFLGCSRCRGDVNLDGGMTMADRTLVSAHMGLSNQGWGGGDLNGDGVVNAADLALVCPPDFNCDGSVGVQDIFDFLNGWFLADPRTDYNGASGVSVQDIFDFLNDWFIGC